jgi:endonuclease I
MPYFLYAVNSEGSGGTWQSAATGTSDSGLPPGLTDGDTAIALQEADNALFNIATLSSGTQAEWLAAIGNRANWSRSDTTLMTMPTSSLTVDEVPPTLVVPDWLLDYNDTCGILAEDAFEFDLTAFSADTSAAISLSAAGEPAGAVFTDVSGTSPLEQTFSWTPTLSDLGTHTVTFDADNGYMKSREITFEVMDYYTDARGLTGDSLKEALHDIIATDCIDFLYDEVWEILDDVDGDPANADNVLLVYSGASMAKSLAGDTAGWDREHSWCQSRGLGEDGYDRTDVHNLFPCDWGVNSSRNNLSYDESDTTDAGYDSPAHADAPDCTSDSDSWEPRVEDRGKMARALFYMAVRYDGYDVYSTDLEMTNGITDTADASGEYPAAMGVLDTLISWHTNYPPDEAESNRNSRIFYGYQNNRNPFIDHPEWVTSIWQRLPPTLIAVDGSASHSLVAGETLQIDLKAIWQGDDMTVGLDAAPSGSMFAEDATTTDPYYPKNKYYIFSWTPDSSQVGTHTLAFYASDADGMSQLDITVDVSSDGLSLPAPENVSATDGTATDSVTVSWDAVADATGYIVWRSASDDPSVTELDATTDASFTDETVVSGKTYTYWIQAVGADHDSDLSAGDSGYAALAAPDNVSATDGTDPDIVAVSWDAVADATEYIVWRSTDSDVATAAEFATTTDAFFEDDSAAFGIRYYYWVQATGSDHDSELSDVNSGHLTVPVPENVIVTRIGPAGAILLWDAVSGAARYLVYASKGPYPLMGRKLVGSTTGTTYRLTVLAGDTKYYTVRAASGSGVLSAFSASVELGPYKP